MASRPSSTSSLPQAAREDAAPTLSQEYDELISKLPMEDGCGRLLRRYHGFLISQFLLPGLLAVREHFKPRLDDLFLASYPKSGTTWSKALIFATTNRAQFPLDDHHPLLRRNPHECVLFMDELFSFGQASKLEALPSPRSIQTHIPYSLLPDTIIRSGCRIVYVARDPKDVFVSLWHFLLEMKAWTEPIPLAKAFDWFCEGKSIYGPVWDHALEYWRESLRRPEKVLFLKYEGMLEDPVVSVKRLAEFMGCPFSPEEERKGVVEELVRLCSFEKLSSLDINRSGRTASLLPQVQNASLFRKGEAGDWMNHLTPEMARKLDGIMDEKLQGSGLSFGRMG